MSLDAGPQPLLELENVSRVYGEEAEVYALREVSLQIFPGDFMSIVGPSGSGKSTMLGLLGCLDLPTSGTVRIAGRDIGALDDAARSRLRGDSIGFVFQQFHLIPHLTALGNVETALLYRNIPTKERRDRARDALEQLGLGARAWESGALAPLPQLAVLGERAQAAAERGAHLALDESAALLAARVLVVRSGEAPPALRVSARDRRRAVRGALWLEAHAHESLDLARVARASGVSPFHFLRLFARVTGVTPHQYLLRARLRRAARLLSADERPIAAIAYDVGFGDVSNFVRTFGRAAGVSPRQFRRARGKERNFLQERIGAATLG